MSKLVGRDRSPLEPSVTRGERRTSTYIFGTFSRWIQERVHNTWGKRKKKAKP